MECSFLFVCLLQGINQVFGRRDEFVDDDFDFVSLVDVECSFDEFVVFGDFVNVSLYGNGFDIQCFDFVDKFFGLFLIVVSDVVDDDVGIVNCQEVGDFSIDVILMCQLSDCCVYLVQLDLL